MNGTQNAGNYTSKDAHELARFVNDVASAEASTSGAMFDSAAAASAAVGTMNGNTNIEQPEVLKELFSVLPDEKDQGRIMRSLFDGVRGYEKEHNARPTGDLILAAVSQARPFYDSANNSHHDQISLFPNAPLIAILGAFGEACPFAGVLPAGIGSNEQRLIIVTHQAGSNWGAYNQGDIMDGIAQGQSFLGSARSIDLTAPNDTANYKFTFLAQKAIGSQAAQGAPLNLLRGRTVITVNGLIAATETNNGSSKAATVSIAGTVNIAGTDYALAGTVQPQNGLVSITPTPALPTGTMVSAEVFVDYEYDGSVTPRMAVDATSYSLFASPYRGIFQVTPEARSQFANEVGVDAGAEALLTVRGQYAMERHYVAIEKAKRVGAAINSATFSFGYAAQILQKTRAQIWQDFQAITGVVSQRMAELTADHGITHMYVTKSVVAQFRSMGTDLFVPSGIVDRPGIFRVGRLFGMFEIYYTPRGVNESADGATAEILCVGRSTQTARCPIIMGDAQAPLFEPLGTTEALKSGYGFSARSFTSINPHQLSAYGCALITVTDLVQPLSS